MSKFPYPHSAPVINLLKGVVYDTNQDLWKALLNHEDEIKKYFEVIGLQVYIDRSEGYAFLRQIESMDDEEGNLPRLVDRRQLSYPLTLLCVLLRKKLLEADAAGGQLRVILEKDQIKEMFRTFLPETSNEARIFDKLDEYINKAVDYGFLRKLKNERDQYEINRVIKARISADTLQNIEQEMREYAKTFS